MKQIIIATKNKGKANEFKEFFKPYNLKALSLNDLEDLPDVEETGETFKENAALKAEEIASILSLPVLADDSGLVIDALDGRPGVYSARYAGEHKDDQLNMEKVLSELRGIPEAKRTARFVCVLAIASPGSKTRFYTGYCEGRIADNQYGENGFGYDPIFIPKGYQQTMAQLSSDKKNQISHRRNAIVQLEDTVTQHGLLIKE
ncbi:MAG: XTP/dITP diphosphatase [Bacillota bacterium]|uniref:dITP/XTP pyrophosphatase n=1 Tax=Virgibacillus salarius TaxID=447199 RepID=A0A941ICS8_9BACI|nr:MULTISPECIES: XTP/dITP diphosphatase [Bacillaceae]MBR7797821.1 XTP/dITP diphosphatase [Virgibacillus salarius]NAZ10531.1 XTP/dITP diphosphatase [Agaribacter marinus]WBX78983.1 XTP/dITP diphosphatase [Virgibacillus salarius]